MAMNEANKLVKTLRNVGLKLALAESVTCGLAASKLGIYKGTSDVLEGAVVCYSEQVKHDLLGVTYKLMKAHTCESMEVTEALARGLKKCIPADIHAATTGLACEGGSETPEKPVGTVFFCILFREKLHKERRMFHGTPSEIREQASLFLFAFILRVMKEALDLDTSFA